MSVQLHRNQGISTVALSESLGRELKSTVSLMIRVSPTRSCSVCLRGLKERAHQRELRNQEERDARDEHQRLERAELEQRESARSEREAQRHELMMAMLARAYNKSE